jgi:hypothetical protein
VVVEVANKVELEETEDPVVVAEAIIAQQAEQVLPAHQDKDMTVVQDLLDKEEHLRVAVAALAELVDCQQPVLAQLVQ